MVIGGVGNKLGRLVLIGLWIDPPPLSADGVRVDGGKVFALLGDGVLGDGVDGFALVLLDNGGVGVSISATKMQSRRPTSRIHLPNPSPPPQTPPSLSLSYQIGGRAKFKQCARRQMHDGRRCCRCCKETRDETSILHCGIARPIDRFGRCRVIWWSALEEAGIPTGHWMPHILSFPSYICRGYYISYMSDNTKSLSTSHSTLSTFHGHASKLGRYDAW